MATKIKTVKTKTVATKVKGKPHFPLFHWMVFWVLVLATVALVCAIFGKIDVKTLKPVGAGNEKSVSAEDQLVGELKDQVAALEESLAKVENASGSTADCATTQVTAIDTYVTYVDKETGVSMSLPYSFGWNGQGCELSPGGPGGFGPGHIYGRYASLHISPRETAAEIIRVETTESTPTSTTEVSAVRNIRRRVINGLTVTTYTQALDIGFTRNTWVAAGRTYTYVIRDDYEWLTDAEAVKIIQSLRVTK